MSDIIVPALSETETLSGGGERRRRTGGRGGDRSRTGAAGKYRNLVNRLAKTELLDPSALDEMHEASLTILEEIGMDIMLPQAREIMKAHGADVTEGSDRVRFDRNLIMDMIATVPERLVITSARSSPAG